MKRSTKRSGRTGAAGAPLLFAAVAAAALAGCSGAKYEKIAPRAVNATQKAFAEQWSTTLMTSWVKGEYSQVGQEATREFRAAHNDAKRQKAAYAYVKGKVGGFKSMAFFEARRSVPPKHFVYRFRGDFERGEAEIRVVLDMNGKVDGHWIKPWRTEMK